jgi:outer membrane biosynthesis protein TonB
MKFVLFNIAVLAALYVLFNPDSVDFHALSARAHATVETVRGAVEPAVAGEAAPVEAVAEQPVAKAPDPNPPAEPAPKPVAMAQVAEKAAPTSQDIPVAKLDPAVAKRRAEVLGLAPPPAAAPAPQADEALMTPEQRRRELFTLAEEMELFYVRHLSR